MNSILLKVAIVAGIGIFLIWMFRKTQPVSEFLCATFGLDPDDEGPLRCVGGKIIPVEQAGTTPDGQTTPGTIDPADALADLPFIGTAIGGQQPGQPDPPAPPVVTGPAGPPATGDGWADFVVLRGTPAWRETRSSMNVMVRQRVDRYFDLAVRWPARYNDRDRRWEPMSDPWQLTAAVSPDPSVPLNVAVGNATGLHPAGATRGDPHGWTAFRPMLPDWRPGSTITDPTDQSWASSIMALVTRCIRANDLAAYMDDLVLYPAANLLRLSLVSPWEFTENSGQEAPQARDINFPGGDRSQTAIVVEHDNLIIRSMAAQFVQWLDRVTLELSELTRPGGGGDTSWGFLRNRTPQPLRGGFTNADGIPLVPRGPWPLALRIWTAECVSGLAATQAPLAWQDQLPRYRGILNRLDDAFLEGWRVSYTDLRPSLYRIMAPYYERLTGYIGQSFVQDIVGSGQRVDAGLMTQRSQYGSVLAARTIFPMPPLGVPS